VVSILLRGEGGGWKTKSDLALGESSSAEPTAGCVGGERRRGGMVFWNGFLSPGRKDLRKREVRGRKAVLIGKSVTDCWETMARKEKARSVVLEKRGIPSSKKSSIFSKQSSP